MEGKPITPEMLDEIRKAKEMLARPIENVPLKGKLDIKWFGHCGFRLSF